MRKKKSDDIKIVLSNKLFYTLIVIGILAIVGVGVYALGSVPNPGHAISGLQTCEEGEILQVVGGEWNCISSVGGYLTGVERVTASGSAGGTTVYCPSRKKLIGGGCSCSNGGEIASSYPMDDHRWRCICHPTSGTISVVALCANAE